MTKLGLRNDVYRRPLATALARVNMKAGWRCADIGAGGGDVSVALAELAGREGRVYAIDSDPLARDETARAAAGAGGAQVIALTQAAEDLVLPEPVELAYCRFLLMHVLDPLQVLAQMVSVVIEGGFVVAQEPITTAGRVSGLPFSMPGARHPDIGATLPALAHEVGLELVDSWAEAPAGAGPGPVATYLETLTEVDPGWDPVVLPPLVTVIGRVGRPAGSGSESAGRSR
ncbi:MAG: class I SAM-dependent methyltransferase [Acidimicrobiales bacterium]